MHPLILITNDDGIRSPGLAAVVEAAQGLGDLLVAAPIRQQTTMGRAFPQGPSTGIIDEVELKVHGIPVRGFAVCGSPAESVAHAVLELAERLPDLCISGINYGENLGSSLTCSGTLGAAWEACSLGIPALAVSQETPLHLQHTEAYPPMDWTTAREVVRTMAIRVLESGLPVGAGLLNLNIPTGASPRVRFTRLSRWSPHVYVKPPLRSFHDSCRLQTIPSPRRNDAEEGSDIHAFYSERVVTATPIGLDLSVSWASARLFEEP